MAEAFASPETAGPYAVVVLSSAGAAGDGLIGVATEPEGAAGMGEADCSTAVPLWQSNCQVSLAALLRHNGPVGPVAVGQDMVRSAANHGCTQNARIGVLHRTH